MKKILLILFFAFVNLTFAQTWTKKNNFPDSARRNTSGFSLNGFGYVCLGGEGPSAGTKHYNTLYQYNQLTDTWSKKDSFPDVPRRGGVAFTIDSFAYVGLGWNNVTTFYDLKRYNPNTNSWDTIADYPGNAGRGAFAIGDSNLAYVGGGLINASSSSYHKDFWEYDPSGNSWTQKADFPFGERANGVIFQHNGKVYAGLGNKAGVAHDDFWEYDPSINSWTQKSDFPGTSRIAPIYFMLNDKFIVGGGSSASRGALRFNDYYQYDPTNNSWDTIGRFTEANYSRGAYFTINDKGYFATGVDSLNRNSRVLFEFSNTTTTDLEEAQNQEVIAVKIHPNPFRNQINIEANEKISNITVVDVAGRLIQNLEMDQLVNEYTLNTENYERGFYTLFITSPSKMALIKLIKE